MKCDEARGRDWLKEVGRIKEELAAEENRMGLRKYLAFAEKEADRILRTKARTPPMLAPENPPSRDVWPLVKDDNAVTRRN